MNISTIGKTLGNCMKGAFIGLLAIAAVSCKSDEKVDTTVPFDPTRPVTVTGFTPESGGYQDQIIVKGSNFGTDKSMVSLKIGGKQAVLVSVMSDKMYGFVPSGAFSGEVEVTIIDKDGKVHSVSPTRNSITSVNPLWVPSAAIRMRMTARERCGVLSISAPVSIPRDV